MAKQPINELDLNKYEPIVKKNTTAPKVEPLNLNPYNQQPIKQVLPTQAKTAEVFGKAVEQAKTTAIGAQEYIGTGIVNRTKTLGNIFQDPKFNFQVKDALDGQYGNVNNIGTNFSQEVMQGQSKEIYFQVKDSLEQKYAGEIYKDKVMINESDMSSAEKYSYRNSVNNIIKEMNQGKSTEEQRQNIINLMGNSSSSVYYDALKEVDNQARKENEYIQKVAKTSYENYLSIEKLNEKYKDTEEWQKDFFTASYTVGQMAPIFVATAVTGGVAGLAGASAGTIGLLAKSISTTLIYQSVYSDTLGNMMLQGVPEDTARNVAKLSGTIEAGTELLFDGLGMIGGGIVGKTAGSALRSFPAGQKIIKALSKVAIENPTLVNGLMSVAGQIGEGAEEFIAEDLNSKVLTMYNLEQRSKEEISQDKVDSFVMGALSGAYMNLAYGAGGKMISKGADILVSSKNLGIIMSSIPENKQIELIGKYIKTPVNFVNVVQDDTKGYLELDGNTVYNAPENYSGHYHTETQSILVNQNEENKFGTVLIHEFTHLIQRAGLYEVYRDEVIKFYDKFYRGGYAGRIQEIADRYGDLPAYKEASPLIKKQMFEDEVVSYFTGDVLLKVFGKDAISKGMVDFAFNNSKDIRYFIAEFYNNLTASKGRVNFTDSLTGQVTNLDGFANDYIKNLRDLFRLSVDDYNKNIDNKEIDRTRLSERTIYDQNGKEISNESLDKIGLYPLRDAVGNIRIVNVKIDGFEKEGYLNSRIEFNKLMEDFDEELNKANEILLDNKLLPIENFDSMNEEDAQRLFSALKLLNYDSLEHNEMFYADNENFVELNSNFEKQNKPKSTLSINNIKKYSINFELIAEPLQIKEKESFYLNFSQSIFTREDENTVYDRFVSLEEAISSYNWSQFSPESDYKQDALDSLKELKRYVFDTRSEYYLSEKHDASGNPLTERQVEDLKDISTEFRANEDEDNSLVPYIVYSKNGNYTYDEQFELFGEFGVHLSPDEMEPLTNELLGSPWYTSQASWRYNPMEVYPYSINPMTSESKGNIGKDSIDSILYNYESNLKRYIDINFGKADFFLKEVSKKVGYIKSDFNEFLLDNPNANDIQTFDFITNALFGKSYGSTYKVSLLRDLKTYLPENLLTRDIHVPLFLRSIYDETGFDGIKDGLRSTVFFSTQLIDIKDKMPLDNSQANNILSLKVNDIPERLSNMVRGYSTYETFYQDFSSLSLNEYPEFWNTDTDGGITLSYVNHEKLRSVFDRVKFSDSKVVFLMTAEDAREEIRSNDALRFALANWSVDVNINMKPIIFEQMTKDENLRSASLSLMYWNFLRFRGMKESDISFQEFLNKPIRIFRGFKTREVFQQERFMSYTFDFSVAYDFSWTGMQSQSNPKKSNSKIELMKNGIDDITIKPIETLGMFTWKKDSYNKEYEILVPRVILKDKSTAYKNILGFKGKPKDVKNKELTLDQIMFFGNANKNMFDNEGRLKVLYHRVHIGSIDSLSSKGRNRAFDSTNVREMFLTDDITLASSYSTSRKPSLAKFTSDDPTIKGFMDFFIKEVNNNTYMKASSGFWERFADTFGLETETLVSGAIDVSKLQSTLQEYVNKYIGNTYQFYGKFMKPLVITGTNGDYTNPMIWNRINLINDILTSKYDNFDFSDNYTKIIEKIQKDALPKILSRNPYIQNSLNTSEFLREDDIGLSTVERIQEIKKYILESSISTSENINDNSALAKYAMEITIRTQRLLAKNDDIIQKGQIAIRDVITPPEFGFNPDDYRYEEYDEIMNLFKFFVDSYSQEFDISNLSIKEPILSQLMDMNLKDNDRDIGFLLNFYRQLSALYYQVEAMKELHSAPVYMSTDAIVQSVKDLKYNGLIDTDSIIFKNISDYGMSGGYEFNEEKQDYEYFDFDLGRRGSNVYVSLEGNQLKDVNNLTPTEKDNFILSLRFVSDNLKLERNIRKLFNKDLYYSYYGFKDAEEFLNVLKEDPTKRYDFKQQMNRNPKFAEYMDSLPNYERSTYSLSQQLNGFKKYVEAESTEFSESLFIVDRALSVYDYIKENIHPRINIDLGKSYSSPNIPVKKGNTVDFKESHYLFIKNADFKDAYDALMKENLPFYTREANDFSFSNKPYYVIRVSTHPQLFSSNNDIGFDLEIILNEKMLNKNDFRKIIPMLNYNVNLFFPQYGMSQIKEDVSEYSGEPLNQPNLFDDYGRPISLYRSIYDLNDFVRNKNGRLVSYGEVSREYNSQFGNVIKLRRGFSKDGVYVNYTNPLMNEDAIFEKESMKVKGNEASLDLIVKGLFNTISEETSNLRMSVEGKNEDYTVYNLLSDAITKKYNYDELLDAISNNFDIFSDFKDYSAEFAKLIVQASGHDAIIKQNVILKNNLLGKVFKEDLIVFDLNQTYHNQSSIEENHLRSVMTQQEIDLMQSEIEKNMKEEEFVKHNSLISPKGKILKIENYYVEKQETSLSRFMQEIGNIKFIIDSKNVGNFNMDVNPTQEQISIIKDYLNASENIILSLFDKENPALKNTIGVDGYEILREDRTNIEVKNEEELIKKVQDYYSEGQRKIKNVFSLRASSTIKDYRDLQESEKDLIFKNIKGEWSREFFVDSLNTKRAVALTKKYYRDANQFEIKRANELIKKHEGYLSEEEVKKNREGISFDNTFINNVADALKEGGFSIHSDKTIVKVKGFNKELEVAPDGFVIENKKYVAVRHVVESKENNLDSDNIDKILLEEYLKDAFANLRFDEEYVGGWVDNGVLYIDISLGIEGDSQRVDTHKVAQIIGNTIKTKEGNTELTYLDGETGLFVKLNQNTDADKYINNVFAGAFIDSEKEIFVGVKKYTNIKLDKNSFNQTVVESGLWGVLDKKIDELVEEGQMTHYIATNEQALDYARRKVNITPQDTKEQGLEKARQAKIELLTKIDNNLRLDKNDFALGVYLLEKFNYYKTSKDYMETLFSLDEVYVEYGQGIQSATLVKRASASGQLIGIQRAIKRIENNFNKKNLGKLNIEIPQDMIDRLLAETDFERIASVIDEIKQEIVNQIPSTWMEKLNAWRYMSMLGTFSTNIRNILGNTIMIPMVATRNVFSTIIESGFVEKEKRTKSILNPLSKEDSKLIEFSKKRYYEYQSFLNKQNKYNEVSSILSNKKVFNNKVLEGMREGIFGSLSGVDEWYSKYHFIREYAMVLKARGITEDTITEQQDIQIAEYALQQAKMATFNDFSQLAKQLQQIEKSGGATGIFVGITVPFKRTPINIGKRGYEYSPLVFFSSLNYIKQVKNGNMTASQFIDKISTGLTGTGLVFAGALLYQTGMITVGADDDDSEKEKMYDYALGKQIYALEIDGKSYTIDWLVPAIIPVIIGAEIQKMMIENEEMDSIFNYVPEALVQAFDPLFELTMLKGVTQSLSSYDSGSGRISDMLSTATSNFVSQLVPALLGQIARTIDVNKRTTYVENADTLTGFLEQTIRKIRSKIPVLSEQNEPLINVKGEEVLQDENPFIRAMKNLLSPTYIQDINITKEDREILRMLEVTGSTSVIPRIPPKTVTINGASYDLSPEEFTKYSKTLGKTSMDILKKIFNNTSYARLSTEDKENIIYDVYDYASSVSKYELNKGYEDSTYEKIKEAEGVGIDVVDYLIVKRVYDTIKGDEFFSKKEKFIEYLRSTKYKDKVNAYLLYVAGYSTGE